MKFEAKIWDEAATIRGIITRTLLQPLYKLELPQQNPRGYQEQQSPPIYRVS